MKLSKKLLYLVIVQSVIGIADSLYLTYEHYAQIIPKCSKTFWFLDCGKVLTSQYSEFYGVPTALLGVGFYASLLAITLLNLVGKSLVDRVLFMLGVIGAAVSVYLVTLQIFIIHAICFYCMVSAFNCLILFSLLLRHVNRLRKTKFQPVYAQAV